MKGYTGIAVAVAVLVVGALLVGMTGVALASGPWGTLTGVTSPWNMGMGGWTGMMGSGPFGSTMMGAWGGTGDGTPISEDEVQRIAEDYVAAYGNPDLEVAEIMAFDNHFYVQAREESTGRYAFEFLIDRYTGATHPEPGPNMMWNTKYGHMSGFGWGGMMGGGWGMGGHMGGGWANPGDEMPISPEQAVRLAQDYLDAYRPGLQADEEADAFYGYYTLHIVEEGEVVGMLSVNGYTGNVWPHTWHGEYLGMVGGEEHGEH